MTKQQKNSVFVKMLKEFPKAFGRVSFRERLMLRVAFDYVVEEIIVDLEKENAELKSEKGCEICTKFDEVKLTKAKEIIENIIRVTWGEGWNYSLDWKVRAEQFLKEIEK